MPEYQLNELAIADLAEIWDYVAERDGPERADRLIDRIFDRLSNLADHPYIGPARPELAPGIRGSVVPSTSFIIFYYPREYGAEIIRVVQGSRRLADLF